MTNGLTHRIIGLAMRLHRALGPGLLESVYHRCRCHELAITRIPFQQDVRLPIRYCGMDIESGYVPDPIVDRAVIVELKAVEHYYPLHKAQLLTYLRLGSCNVGRLINFNTVSLTDGIRRCVMTPRGFGPAASPLGTPQGRRMTSDTFQTKPPPPKLPTTAARDCAAA